jgi:hypothetical protein
VTVALAKGAADHLKFSVDDRLFGLQHGASMRRAGLYANRPAWGSSLNFVIGLG